MIDRRSIALLGIGALVAAAIVASTRHPMAAGGTTSNTAWGDPDLQGLWRGLHRINFERPPNLQGKEFFTDEEIAKQKKGAKAH